LTTPWSVPRDWAGETAAVLAGGPSLTREQVEAVRGKCRVIAVSNTAIDTVDSETKAIIPAFAPWADVLYAADLKWWRHYQDQALKFPGIKVTIGPRKTFHEVYSLERSDCKAYDPHPTRIVYGGNSGYQALHLAVQFGAKRVLLLGFDMKNGRRGRKHWFGSHPGKLNSNAQFNGWIRAFDRFSKVLTEMGITVINCSPDTALRCFRRASVEKALNGH
jgi:hypothetical protein